MKECKRNGCTRPAETRPRYEGFCSLACRDMHGYETEITTLTEQLQRAAEQNYCTLCGKLLNQQDTPLEDEIAKLKAERDEYQKRLIEASVVSARYREALDLALDVRAMAALDENGGE